MRAGMAATDRLEEYVAAASAAPRYRSTRWCRARTRCSWSLCLMEMTMPIFRRYDGEPIAFLSPLRLTE